MLGKMERWNGGPANLKLLATNYFLKDWLIDWNLSTIKPLNLSTIFLSRLNDCMVV
jgi:hypothetical protein